jgi:hypothetical protein
MTHVASHYKPRIRKFTPEHAQRALDQQLAKSQAEGQRFLKEQAVIFLKLHSIDTEGLDLEPSPAQQPPPPVPAFDPSILEDSPPPVVPDVEPINIPKQFAWASVPEVPGSDSDEGEIVWAGL